MPEPNQNVPCQSPYHWPVLSAAKFHKNVEIPWEWSNSVQLSSNFCIPQKTAVSHVFNVSGYNVNVICAVTDSMPLDRRIVIRRIKFLEQISKLHSQHVVLYKIYQQFGRKELHWLRYILFIGFVIVCLHVHSL